MPKYTRRTPSAKYLMQGSHLNQIYDDLESAGRLNVAPPLFVQAGPNGQRTVCLALPPGATLLRLTTTATGAGTYNARVQKVTTNTQSTSTDLDLATWVGDMNTSDDAVFENVAENNAASGSHLLTTGANSFVVGWLSSRFASDVSNRPIYVGSQAPTAYIEFRVNLSSTSGSGTAGWVYTATAVSGGATLGTGLSPEMPHWGNTTAASGGIGYYDNTGAFHLSIAFEGRGKVNC